MGVLHAKILACKMGLRHVSQCPPHPSLKRVLSFFEVSSMFLDKYCKFEVCYFFGLCILGGGIDGRKNTYFGVGPWLRYHLHVHSYIVLRTSFNIS